MSVGGYFGTCNQIFFFSPLHLDLKDFVSCTMLHFILKADKIISHVGFLMFVMSAIGPS